MGGMGALVQHVWHGRKDVSKGCISGGICVMGSVFAMFCCGWYECNSSFYGNHACVDWSLVKYESNKVQFLQGLKAYWTTDS